MIIIYIEKKTVCAYYLFELKLLAVFAWKYPKSKLERVMSRTIQRNHEGQSFDIHMVAPTSYFSGGQQSRATFGYAEVSF